MISTQADGKGSHVEHETVIDFQYDVDLTNFVFPYGYIQSEEMARGQDLDGDGKVESVFSRVGPGRFLLGRRAVVHHSE